MSQTLQQRLDEYVAGISSESTLCNDLAAYCKGEKSSTWDALALLDRYYRQGKLSSDLHRKFSIDIKRRAMGFDTTEVAVKEAPPVVDAPIDVAAPVVIEASEDVLAPDRAADTSASAVLAAEVLSLREQLAEARRQTAHWRDQISQSSLQSAATVVRDARQPAPQIDWSKLARPVHFRAVSVVAVLSCCVALAVSGRLGDPAHDRQMARQRAQQLEQRLAQLPSLPAPATGAIGLSASRYIARPGAKTVEITVRRDGGTAGEVSFEWWAQSAGAKAGRDFGSAGRRRVTIPDGTDLATLAVPILPNAARKHTELFYVAIAKPAGGATLGEITRAPVFIMSR